MLSRSDIIANASVFSKTWKDASDEDADAKSFWDALFLVYGTPRKNVARFEVAVKREGKGNGYIDLLWKGKLLVEHKSKGKSLADARTQAQEYVLALKPQDRPEWLVVCDFENFEVINQKTAEEVHFKLADLASKIDVLGFIGGFTPKKPSNSAPVNIKAVELLGDIYDALKAGGYPQHELAPLLVRILFSLFAEDTAIFEPEQFRTLILDNTAEDGSDLGSLLDRFFEILNTPPEKRQALTPDFLKAFPYVNGALFDHRLPNAAMSKDMRDALLKATEFDWTQISPAIFGSLFQSVMESAERRALGAHYTSEDDILKIIKPLFLDELEAELEQILADKSTKRNSRLDDFHSKLASLRFLDPACGCGNFLIIAYRELRRLETRLLKERHKDGLVLTLLAKLNVDMMYGIELEEFPSEIAKVGMWLMDHICNTELAATFGKSFTRLPLNKSATIKCDNALTTDWGTVLAPNQCSYIMGNPPFVGKKEQTEKQKIELQSVFSNKAKAGNLDYVTGWYVKAADFIHDSTIRCAFVSTNSISQGEQVAEIWAELFRKGIKIDFAHRTFAWQSEARGKAHVHVVIIGFSLKTTVTPSRVIFDHSDPLHTRTVIAKNINPYLVEGSDIVVTSRTKPLCLDAPKMAYGSMMIDKSRKAGDDEGLVFTEAEAKAIISNYPGVAADIKTILGADEFLNNTPRKCLWAPVGLSKAVSNCPPLMDRISKVRIWRASSDRDQTKKLAATPYRFGEVRQPASTFIFIPKVSSQRRTYIPIALLDPDIIASGSALVIDKGDMYQFGILHSLMHNSWMRAVAGRMKSDYQYSANVVYNNFVWPIQPTATQKAVVEAAAQAILTARNAHTGTSLAELYDPLKMPVNLVKAHNALDKAVDDCYRKQPFTSEMERIQFLFKLYEQKIAPLAVAATKKATRKKPS